MIAAFVTKSCQSVSHSISGPCD